MSDLNMVQLIGRLGADPEIRYTAAGAAIANLRLATGSKWKDKDTGEAKESTEWHRVVFFGRTAEIASEYLMKGSQVYIRGSLRTRQWEDSEGQTRYTTEIVGQDMNMLGSRPQGTRPAQEAQPAAAAAPAKQATAAANDGFAEEEIPF